MKGQKTSSQRCHLKILCLSHILKLLFRKRFKTDNSAPGKEVEIVC